ncbi:ABC transporter permease subunit [Paenibacillus sp. UNC451MF]|uniref:ABC transporter permease subunit n=1 Tax=Paenibacillus sp. UNC451MF TaxID=1449063 RepID=UPI000A49FE2F|nr:hypothetical protein [Paenibacillus sp. UNC451MF]
MMTAVYSIARADFLERVRQQGFLVTLFLTVLLGNILSPPRNGSYVTLVFDHYVGLYNSAWMGTSVAISFSVFFSLLGFYFISKAVGVDRHAGTGPIIAASGVGRSTYILGKFFSNWAILCVIAVVTMLSALVMQWVRGEDRAVDLWALVSPFLFLTLPLISLISAVAIWFEIIPWLRGTQGNVCYFAAWLLTVFAGTKSIPLGSFFTFTDPFGRAIPLASITESLKEQFPEYNGQFSQGLTMLDAPIQTFLWYGVDWTFPVIVGRMVWIVAAVILAWTASFFFRRFQVRSGPSIGGKQQADRPVEIRQTDSAFGTALSWRSLTPATPVTGRALFLALLGAELRLMLSGARMWLFVAYGLMILCFIAPFGAVERVIWPMAWLWPLAVWSAAGTREYRFCTEELLYASPGPITRQLHVQWIAGIVLTMLISSGVAVRLLMEQEMTMLSIWAAGAVFVPTLALACGVWIRSGKTFEIVYMALWYLGPLNGAPLLNFMDLTAGYNVWIYLTAALILYTAALLGRIKRLNE